MAFIKSFLETRKESRTIDVLTDDTLVWYLDRDRRDNIIDDYFTNKTFESRNFQQLLTERIIKAASIVAYGAEIPLTMSGKLDRVRSQLIKIGLGTIFDEERQWEMRDAMYDAQWKGLSVTHDYAADGSIIRKGSRDELASYIYGTVDSLIKGVIVRQDSLKFQVLEKCQVDYVDNRTESRLSIDWKKPGVSYNHYPNALVATGNTVTPTLNKWNDTENANGLQNLFEDVNTYIDTNGFPPDAVIMSRDLYLKLLQQKSTKDAASSLTVAQVGTVSPEVLDKMLQIRGIPPIQTIDFKYYEENEKGEEIPTRFYPNNKYSFARKGMGLSAIGPVLESSKIVVTGGDRIPEPKTGFYVHIEEKKQSPPMDLVSVISTFLPIALNPKYFFTHQVN